MGTTGSGLRAWLPIVLLGVGTAGAWADLFAPKNEDKELRKRQRRIEEERERVPAPPRAIARQVDVMRGGRVAVVLEGRGYPGETLIFKIRSAPSRGRLEPFEQSAVDSTSVLYIHDGGDSSSDQFSYAVQAPGTGVSRSADVLVRIRDPEAEIAWPERIDFGPVTVGGAADADVVVENPGAGPVSAELRVLPPWSVEGERRFRLVKGGRHAFRLRFAPTQVRSYEAWLIYEGWTGRRTRLTGSGSAAFTVDPPEVRIWAATPDGSRRGALRVRNWAATPLTLEIAGGQELGLPPSVRIPAGAVEEVEVRVGAGHVGKLEGELRLSGAGQRVVVPVAAGALPARVEVSPDGLVDLGTVVEGEAAQARFQVENRGGEPTQVRVQPGAGLQIAPTDLRFVLGVGERRELKISMAARNPGHLRSSVAISFPGGETRRQIAAVVEERPRPAPAPIAEPDPPATPASGPADDPRVGRHSLSEISSLIQRATREGNIAPWALMPSVVRVRNRSLDLAWDAPKYQVTGYRLEMRRTVPVREGGELRVGVEWFQWPRLSWRLEGKRVAARCDGLEPGCRYLMRIRSLDGAGRLSVPSFNVMAVTSPARGGWGWAFWIVGVAAAAGALMFAMRGMRRATVPQPRRHPA